MDNDLERRFPLVALDLNVLTRLVQPAFPGAEVETAAPLETGYVNTNVRFTLRGRDTPFVLRLHMRGENVARVEWAVLRLLASRVPLAPVLWTGLEDGPEGRPYSIHRFVEGVPMDQVLREGGAEDVADCARAAGEVLGRAGGFTFPHGGFLGPDLGVAEPFPRPSQAVRGYIEHALFQNGGKDVLGDALTAKVWGFALRHAHRLDRVSEATSLVHADFHARHILMGRKNGAWAVNAVLDWEFAFSGPQLFDVGTMLRPSDNMPPAFAAPFALAFVEAGGDLPDHWHPLARLCDMVNLLDFLTRPEHSEGLRKQSLSDLTAYVEEGDGLPRLA